MAAPLIAVVDDDPDILAMLDTLLTDAGYRTFLWPRGKDAHLQIRQIKPDLLIVDMWMEDRDAGRMVMGLMELDPGTRDIPVIVCSAHVRELRSRIHEFRGKGHVIMEKPFAIDDLLTTVEQLLAGKGSA